MCEGARDIWRMGLWNLINEACATVLEYLIKGKFPKPHDMDHAKLEVFITSAWYIWWIRRQKIMAKRSNPYQEW
jgi:hypothetical protein